MRFGIGIFALVILAARPAYAAFCDSWEAGLSIGNLSPKVVREASGVATSPTIPDRVYWVNDSGDRGFIHYGTPDGKNLKSIKIQNFKPRDVEALAITECEEGSCLAIGDIGDNSRKRKNVKITFVREEKNFTSSVRILRTVTLEYPDGPHDAESMAFLPGGELFIITKEIFVSRLSSENARVYTLSKKQWSAGGKHTLKFHGELPLKKWLSQDNFYSQVPRIWPSIRYGKF